MKHGEVPELNQIMGEKLYDLSGLGNKCFHGVCDSKEGSWCVQGLDGYSNIANVKVYKKGVKNDCNNYSSTSFITVISNGTYVRMVIKRIKKTIGREVRDPLTGLTIKLNEI